ncbi:hypothetical protein FKM82_016456 [Ascaphus truei]
MTHSNHQEEPKTLQAAGSAAFHGNCLPQLWNVVECSAMLTTLIIAEVCRIQSDHLEIHCVTFNVQNPHAWQDPSFICGLKRHKDLQELSVVSRKRCLEVCVWTRASQCGRGDNNTV